MLLTSQKLINPVLHHISGIWGWGQVLPRVYDGRPFTGGVRITRQPRPAGGADAGSAEGWKRGATPQTFRWLQAESWEERPMFSVE